MSTLPLVMLLIALPLAWVTRRRKLHLRRKLVRSPLAGYDTGVRSPFRVPSRFGHKRGF